jgi:hypothetical protein
VHWSQCGTRLISAGLDKVIRLFNAETGELVAFLEGHGDAVNHAKFDPHGKRVVSCSDDSRIFVWDAVEGNLFVLYDVKNRERVGDSVVVRRRVPRGRLTGSSVRRAIAHRRHLYSDVAEALFGGANPRIKGYFLWGMAQVLSRALSGGPQNMPLTLIPGVDMVNHSATHNAAVHFDAASATFSLAATHDVAEDDEVLISYGSGRDTASFMAVYGFFEKNNPNDVLKLALAPHREATLPLTLLLSLDGSYTDSYSALAATGPTGDLPADKVAELRRHADVVIASVKKGLGDALLAPARGVVRQASASAAGGTAEDSAVATLALKRCDDALAAFLPGPAGAAGVAAHQLPSSVAPAAEARLQFLLKEAATGTTQWRRHCAVAASRELDGLLRLRATCQAYCAALSVRNS